MTNHTSPVRIGARRGLPTGIYLGVMFMSSLLLSGTVLDGAVSMAMVILFPVFIYRILRTDLAASGGKMSTGALWLEGLTAIMGGALIASTIMFIYLRWIEPDFLSTRWAEMIEQLASAPDPAMNELAANFESASANGFVVSPIMLTMSMLWSAAFTGSILSLIAAAIAKALYRQRPAVNNIEK